MNDLPIPTVRDHLNVLSASPAWMISLGEMIQAVTGCDAALAALRARDLGSHVQLAQGLELFTRGYSQLVEADCEALTPLQRETLERVLVAMEHHLFAHMHPEENHAE